MALKNKERTLWCNNIDTSVKVAKKIKPQNFAKFAQMIQNDIIFVKILKCRKNTCLLVSSYRHMVDKTTCAWETRSSLVSWEATMFSASANFLLSRSTTRLTASSWGITETQTSSVNWCQPACVWCVRWWYL